MIGATLTKYRPRRRIYDGGNQVIVGVTDNGNGLAGSYRPVEQYAGVMADILAAHAADVG